jgi:hypothetical protein
MNEQGPRWGSSRARERNKARYLIRNHVALECENSDIINPTQSNNQSTLSKSSNTSTETIQKLFKAVSDGNPSQFSLKLIASNFAAIQNSHSFEYLSIYKVTTLCTSRFGKEYAKAALYYREHKGNFTMIEYASIIGEYGIVSSLIAGGINPLPTESILQGSLERRNQVSKLVLKKFMASMVPRTLSVYIIKSIFVMKMWTFYHGSAFESKHCPICHEYCALISFQGDCNHSCCELCHWEVTVTELDERTDGDVMKCPVCSLSAVCTIPKRADSLECPYFLCNLSLERFNSLPANSQELRNIKRPAKKKNLIHSTWNEALEASCGKSKDVRMDKFIRYVTTGAKHHCHACLRAGVLVNDVNEFNQSPLFISVWLNHYHIVQLLLKWGADPNLKSNGNISALNVAKVQGHHDTVSLLLQFGADLESESLTERLVRFLKHDIESAQINPIVTTLIHPSSPHPGAGSCYIDDCLTEECLDFFIELHQEIPIADDCQIKKKKSRICSLRHNFCDSENTICHILEACIKKSLNKHAVVFPHMKFLNYDKPGSILPPHIDLTKVDIVTQNRSTHTLILYLYDCKEGGETALLEELSPDGPYAYHKVIANVCPRKGRLLLFPHACPHEGKEVISTPKLLLRGEVMFPLE